MMKSLLLTIFISFFAVCSFAQAKQAIKKTPAKTYKSSAAKKTAPVKNIVKFEAPKLNSNLIKITTDSGIIVIKLSDSTPLHRDNFIKLVKEGFYDSLLFHRVIPGFMIQGGDPTSKNAALGTMLGSGGDDMARIPAEFDTALIHKKGALAAARDGNPEKASSACQFYLVEGKIATDAELDMMEQRQGRKYSPQQRAIYKTIGGTPFLDMNYTVFGEVVSGLEIIAKIANAPRDQANRPLGNVRMKMELVK